MWFSVPSSVVSSRGAIRADLRVAVVPECEETEQKTKTEKLGTDGRTGVRKRGKGVVLLERCDWAGLLKRLCLGLPR